LVKKTEGILGVKMKSRKVKETQCSSWGWKFELFIPDLANWR
jgi:hypothetical protein